MPVPGFNRPGDGGGGLNLTQKLNLVNAIGSPATMADSFQTLVNRVSNKRRWASGTFAVSGSTATFKDSGGNSYAAYKGVVSGLVFKPSRIILETVSSYYGAYYNADDSVNYRVKMTNGGASGNVIQEDGSVCYVNSTGFSLPIGSNASLGMTVTWYAYE